MKHEVCGYTYLLVLNHCISRCKISCHIHHSTPSPRHHTLSHQKMCISPNKTERTVIICKVLIMACRLAVLDFVEGPREGGGGGEGGGELLVGSSLDMLRNKGSCKLYNLTYLNCNAFLPLSNILASI